MQAKDHFKAGQLAEAIAAAKEEVRAQPGNVSPRVFLAELLCFAGDAERAEQQLDTATQVDPRQAVGIALLRQLLRAEVARRQFHSEGRLPEFLDQPSEELKRRLSASIAIREGKLAEAAKLLEESEAARPRLRGVLNGQPFDDLRDLDDLTASFLEVLTTNGKYYWIPLERVESAEFKAPTGPEDLLWRSVKMSVRGGPDGEVYLPVLYHGSHAAPTDALRLGRATDWQGGDGSPVRGLGQRTFLAGDQDLGILELKSLEVTGAGGA
jgi:type VI secretion system protein ImpE